MVIFCLFKVLAAPPKWRVAAPDWVIRGARTFIVQRVAAPPDGARCSASSGFWDALQRLRAARCGTCLLMRGALRHLHFYGAARGSASSSGGSQHTLRGLERLAAPPSSAWRRPLGNCFAAPRSGPCVCALQRSTCARYSAAHLHYLLSTVQHYLVYLLLCLDGAKLFINVPVGTGVRHRKRNCSAHRRAVCGINLPC